MRNDVIISISRRITDRKIRAITADEDAYKSIVRTFEIGFITRCSDIYRNISDDEAKKLVNVIHTLSSRIAKSLLKGVKQ